MKSFDTRPRFRPPSGYSLFEMMIVLSLMILLYAVASTGAKKSWQSQELKASAIHLAHDLTLASQTAQKLNKPVVVRFYRYFADAVASEKPHYHAYQLLVHEPEADTPANVTPILKPISEVQTLEGTTLISENARFTTVLWSPPDQPSATDPNLSIGPYDFFSIEFRPNGSTNIAPPSPNSATGNQVPTITLIPAVGADDPGTLPKEFQTLVLHPDVGTVTIF